MGTNSHKLHRLYSHGILFSLEDALSPRHICPDKKAPHRKLNGNFIWYSKSLSIQSSPGLKCMRWDKGKHSAQCASQFQFKCLRFQRPKNFFPFIPKHDEINVKEGMKCQWKSLNNEIKWFRRLLKSSFYNRIKVGSGGVPMWPLNRSSLSLCSRWIFPDTELSHDPFSEYKLQPTHALGTAWIRREVSQPLSSINSRQSTTNNPHKTQFLGNMLMRGCKNNSTAKSFLARSLWHCKCDLPY